MVIYKSDIDERYGFQPEAPAYENQEMGGPPVYSGMGDIGRGVLYGITEAPRGAYNFINALDDMMFDWLPEWEQPIMEAPESVMGSIAAGMTQFLLPYGLLNKGIKALNATKIGVQHPRTGAVLNWLDGSRAVTVAEVAKKTEAGGRLSTMTGVAMSFAGGAAGRGAAKGAVVDFLAFDGNEGRLSDLISEYPGVVGEVAEFMKTDEEDPELLGRLKNAFEGAVLGVAFDSVVDGIRAQHAFRKIKRAGGDDDQAVEAAMNAFEDSKASRKAQAELEEDIEIEAQRIEEYEMLDAEGNIVTRTGADKDEAAATVADMIERSIEVEDMIKSNVDTAGDVAKTAKEIDDEGFSNINPRKDKEGREKFNLDRLDSNLSYYFGDEGFAIRLRRQIERRAKEKAKMGPEEFNKHKDIFAAGIDDVAKLGKKTLQEQNEILMSMGENGEALRKMGYEAFMWRTYADRLATEIQPMIKAYRGRQLDAKQLKMLYTAFETMSGAVSHAAEIFSGAGRILNIARIGISDDAVNSIAKGERFIKPLDDIKDMVNNPEAIDPDKIDAVLADLDMLTKSENPLDNLKALDEYLNSSFVKRGFRQLQEAHINGLLSGISTQVVNATSAMGMAFWRPIENLFGSALDYTYAKATGDLRTAVGARALMTQEFHSLMHLHVDFISAFRAIKQSGANPYESLSMLDKRPISPLQASLGDNPLTKMIRLPSRTLEGMDNFMKQWSGRNRARGVLYQKVLRKNMHPSQAARQVEDMLDKLQSKRGDFRKELVAAKELAADSPRDQAGMLGEDPNDPNSLINMSEKDIDALILAKEEGVIRGQEVTFTHKMRDDGTFGKLGSALQNGLEKVPIAKLMIPFVRTPANLADYGWDYSFGAALGGIVEGARKTVNAIPGVNFARSEQSLLRMQRDLASSDAMTRARARTRMAFGVGFGTSVLIAADQIAQGDDSLPRITGSGPSNPDAQKALKEAGWQPFSIRIGDSYYSYARLDPIGTVLGAMVDSSEYIRENADDDDYLMMAQATFTASLVSIANNITSKTYMKGVTDLLEVINDPDNRGEAFLGSVAGSFVPTIVASAEKALDPEIQEIRSITDRIMSRIPGASSRLPVRRNLLGEAMEYDQSAIALMVSPMRATQVKDDLVRKELARFAYGFTMPTTTRAGVDLLDEAYDRDGVAAYDRFTELVGEVKLQGKDLRQTLRQKFKSQEYQRLSPDDGDDGDHSPRILEINAELRKFRSKAWSQLRKERPEIERALRERKQRIQQRRNGGTLTL